MSRSNRAFLGLIMSALSIAYVLAGPEHFAAAMVIFGKIAGIPGAILAISAVEARP